MTDIKDRTDIEYGEAPPAVDFGSLTTAVGTAPPVVQDVTYERILDARSEPQNWLTYYGAYDGQRYSPLDQITTENVVRMTPAWVFSFSPHGLHAGQSTYAFENSPIVVDGVMYISGWDGWVWALDAKTGQLLWQYKHAIPFDTSLCCGNVNRGVAVANGKVFVCTLNAHVLALDATNGACIWDVTSGDVRAGESLTVAPLVVKDRVVVGSSGGEFGVRGHLDAYDMETGERVWRCYTIPKPGEPGSETWPQEGEAWTRGGANGWITGTFDPETNLLYWGTGNPAPDFDGEVRPGDNLHTDSVIAVDADTGEIRWHYQCTPHGQVTPRIYPEAEGEEVHFYPGPAGAKEWTHAAYSQKTGLFYVPVQDTGATVARRRREFKESIPYWGAAVVVDAEDLAGSVTAFDPSTGQEVWRWRNKLPMCASVLATAGDLVFAGTPAGQFVALDARSGEMLWQFNCGSGHHSSPITYSVEGKQYVAVPVGWGAWVEGFLPGMMGGPHGQALFVFSLPEDIDSAGGR